MLLDDTKTTPAGVGLPIAADNALSALNSAGSNSIVSISKGAMPAIGHSPNQSSTLSGTITETGTGMAGALNQGRDGPARHLGRQARARGRRHCNGGRRSPADIGRDLGQRRPRWSSPPRAARACRGRDLGADRWDLPGPRRRDGNALRDTSGQAGGAVIVDSTSGGAIKLAGISKAQLAHDRGDFAFHA